MDAAKLKLLASLLKDGSIDSISSPSPTVNSIVQGATKALAVKNQLVRQMGALPTNSTSVQNEAYWQGFNQEKERLERLRRENQNNPNNKPKVVDENLPGTDAPPPQVKPDLKPDANNNNKKDNPYLVPMLAAFLMGLTSKQQKKPTKLTEKQQAAIDEINKVREKHGKGPIKGDPKLCEAAAGHSDKMKESGQLKHANLSAYNLAVNCENIAKGYTDPKATVKQWEKSEGHLKNILSLPDGAFVGVSPDSQSGKYWTMIGSRKGSDGSEEIDPRNIA